MNPFAPPHAPSSSDPAAPRVAPGAAAAAFAALLLGGAISALRAPVQPPFLLAVAFLPFGLALILPRAPRILALPVLLVLPMAMLSASLAGDELQVLNDSLHATGWTLLVETVICLPPAWVLAGGDWRRGVAGLAPFLLAVGLRDQAAILGFQFVVPGVVVWLTTALLPYTAARPGVGIVGALGLSVREIVVAPLAWVVTLVGPVCGALIQHAILALGGDHPLTILVDPYPATLLVRGAAYAASSVVYGLTLWLGATLYHRR